MFLYYCLKLIQRKEIINVFRIKDSNGNEPIKLTSDKNIQRLINKLTKHKKISNEELVDTGKFTFLRNFSFIPPKPPKTLGFIEKMGKFIFNFNVRFIEVDALGGSFKRYKRYEDYPNSPLDIIPLRDINVCKRINSIYYSSSLYYFEINYEHRQVYRLKTEDSCNKWIEVLNAAIIYSKFFLTLLERDSQVAEYFSKIKEEVNYIEYDRETDTVFKKRRSTGMPAEETKEKEKEKDKKKDKTTKTDPKKKKERRKNPYSQGQGNLYILIDRIRGRYQAPRRRDTPARYYIQLL